MATRMATLSFTAFLFVVIPQFLMTTCDGDPCNTYTPINEPYRSVKYKLSVGEVPICDNKLTQGWYRFTSIVGRKNANDKARTFLLWNRGTDMDAGSSSYEQGRRGKRFTACTNLHNRRNGCLFKLPLSVKNCGDYFVYNLRASRSMFHGVLCR